MKVIEDKQTGDKGFEQGFSPIDINEIQGGDTPPSDIVTPERDKEQPKPTATPPTPDVTPIPDQLEQEPEHQPEEEKETPAPDVLADLFGQTEDAPEVEQAPEEELKGDTPKRLRQVIADQKKKYEQELQDAREAQQAEIQQREALEAQLRQFREEAAITDPSLAPEVAAARDALDRGLKDTARRLTPKAAREFLASGQPLIEEYLQLGEVFDDGYDERYEALSGKLEESFGHQASLIMQSMPDLGRKVEEVKNQVQAVSSNSSELMFRRQERVHRETAQAFDANLKLITEFNEDLAKTNPFAPQNVLARLAGGSKEYADQRKRVQDFVRSAVVPPAPPTKAELAGMDEQQRSQFMQTRLAEHQKRYMSVLEVLPLAMDAMQAIPLISKMLADRSKEIKELRDSDPPKPTYQESAPQKKEPAINPLTGLTPITLDEIQD